MIPFTNDRGLRDWRSPVSAAPRRQGPRWLLLALLLVAIAALACHRIVLLPGPLTHDIGAWLDIDQVCVAEPAPLYITKRCLSMAAIRGLILTTRHAHATP